MRSAILVCVIFLAAACGGSEGPKGETYEVDGIALGGYDPVSYFEQSEPRLGIENTTSKYQGLTYQFTSTKNKSLFDENPEKYIPAYGGWCAYAVAETATKMQPDPTMWQIQDGRLLLFYDDWMSSLTGSLKGKWNEDADNYLIKADENWPSVQAQQ